MNEVVKFYLKHVGILNGLKLEVGQKIKKWRGERKWSWPIFIRSSDM
jgi:hypothetical protein